MRGEVKDEIPEYWVCESCQSASYSTLIETEKNDEAVTRALRNGKFSVSQLHSNKQKTVETVYVSVGGKTKDVQEGELPKFPPSFSSYITFFPAPNATWKWKNAQIYALCFKKYSSSMLLCDWHL
uniref:Uncharacterized protein n=1 Tax=Cannabis sativa TaxID=3483 RepID=A0A803PB98_CANSA